MKQLNGVLYAAMIKNGAAALKNKKSEVNDLNVFPIPDGDTGETTRVRSERPRSLRQTECCSARAATAA